MEDIHNYKAKYEACKKIFSNLKISARNKELILEFERKCVLIDRLSYPTRIKYLQVFMILFKFGWIKKDFDKFERKDFEELITNVQDYSKWKDWTKIKSNTIVKKFGKWLAWRDEAFKRKDYPKSVEFIKTSMKRKDLPLISEADILTEEEIAKFLEVCNNAKQKAFVSMIYELGSRVSEIGNLQIKNLTRKEYNVRNKIIASYDIDLKGKTGIRTCTIVQSACYLDEWLNLHPNPKPDSALWIHNSKSDEKMSYETLRKMILRLAKKVGIKKRVYPHLFRHTRATHILRSKLMNEAQVKAYFGWTQDSSQLATYSHVVSADANESILQANGIMSNGSNGKKEIVCVSCGSKLLENRPICPHCNKLSSYEAKEALDNRNEKRNEFIDWLMEDKEVFDVVAKKCKKDPSKFKEIFL